MNTTPLIPGRLLGGKSWLAAALILLQFACSANNDPALGYDANSSVNPIGPAAPDNDSLAPPDPRNPANWYSDGDLESGIGPWYAQEGVTITRSSAQSRSGSYSLLVEGRSDSGHGPVMPLLTTLPSGQYEASVWVLLAEGEETAELSLVLKADGGGADGSATVTGVDGSQKAGTDNEILVRSAEVAAGEWKQLSGTFNLDTPGRWENLALTIVSPNETLSYYVDDLSLVSLSNLIVNGGVEDGIQPWRSQGAPVMIIQSSEQSNTGDHSLLVSGRTENWNGPVMDLPPLSPGRTYAASVWVRLAPSTPATQLNLTLKRTVTGGPEEYIQLGTAEVTSASWVELAGSFTHAAEGTLQEHFLYIESSPEGATASFYVDDLELALPSQLILNGDVESSLAGWGPFGPVTLERTSMDAYSGDYSVLVTKRDAEWQGASFSVMEPQAGDVYLLSCYVRMAPENPDADVSMTIKLNDETFIYVAGIDATESWVQLMGYYQHDPNGTETEFTPYIQASEATAEYLIDSCSATRP